MSLDNRIHVLKDNTDVLSVISEIVINGLQKEAFCVCDVSDMIEKNVRWKEVFPKISIFYEVRCNNTRIVLEIQAALGVGFSCVSKEEIRRVISLGISPDRIFFANPTKKISHLVYAAEVGVNLISFDSEEELYKIKKHHPFAQLVLRIDTEEQSEIPKKYGMQTETEIKHVLNVAKSLDLNVMGLIFYSESTENYSKAILTAKRIFMIGSNLDHKFSLLVFGGLNPGKKEFLLLEVSKVIQESLDVHFPKNDIKVIAEVGKYCVEAAFKTVTYIHSKRILNDDTRMYYLDVGIYNGLAPVICQNYFKFQQLQRNSTQSNSNVPLYPSILWGPTCDSTDQITKDNEYLPDMKIGEWLIFEDTGAYTFPLMYEFNGFTLPNIHSVIKSKDWLMFTNNANVLQLLPLSKFVTGELAENYSTGQMTYVFKNQYS